MKQKVSLLIGVVAIVIIILLSIKRPPIVPEHPKLDGTNAVLINKETKSNLKNYLVNFYMENSASMDGYVNGNTEALAPDQVSAFKNIEALLDDINDLVQPGDIIPEEIQRLKKIINPSGEKTFKLSKNDRAVRLDEALAYSHIHLWLSYLGHFPYSQYILH